MSIIVRKSKKRYVNRNDWKISEKIFHIFITLSIQLFTIGILKIGYLQADKPLRNQVRLLFNNQTCIKNFTVWCFSFKISWKRHTIFNIKKNIQFCRRITGAQITHSCRNNQYFLFKTSKVKISRYKLETNRNRERERSV